MCGISGEIRFDGEAADTLAVRRMTDGMKRRGPDGHGVFACGPVALGHRRLKIIDLSENASQPMHDKQNGLTIVYNGAIYNYPELRAELQEMGYHFFSTGDTEVILKGFHAWGKDVLKRLNGMFAFAIYNHRSGQIFAARDRLGIKPFYYVETDEYLRFASSLPALLAAGDVDTSIDPIALNYYMTFHAVVPAPHTMLKGVRKLPPATYLEIERDGSRRQTNYWQVSYPDEGQHEKLDDKEWEQRVLDVMRTASERRLIADVPVGVLLSGGLDSSMVVGLLAEAGHSDISTFSIGFDAAGGEEGDEFKYSDIIANEFGTDHHQIRIDAKRTLTALPDCIEAMAEPMVSHDVIGFYLLSQRVAEHVKVVESGQGADEIFAGYHWYPPMLTSQDPVSDYAKVFFDRDYEEYKQAIHPDYHGGDFALQMLNNHFAAPGAQRAIDKTLRIDSTVMLIDDPVKRVDNMTMAWGLEARVPFLDHEVVELAAQVPAELKVKSGGKHILKEAARQVIPSGVIDRPKGYFPVPALKYLQGPYLEFVQDILNQPAARKRGLFQKDYVDTLMAAPDEHITPLRGSKLWQIALLESWLQTHGIEA